ncbi:hypothetical protein V8C37DRAFT_237107 [Trichoderma ceciliae]
MYWPATKGTKGPTRQGWWCCGKAADFHFWPSMVRGSTGFAGGRPAMVCGFCAMDGCPKTHLCICYREKNESGIPTWNGRGGESALDACVTVAQVLVRSIRSTGYNTEHYSMPLRQRGGATPDWNHCKATSSPSFQRTGFIALGRDLDRDLALATPPASIALQYRACRSTYLYSVLRSVACNATTRCLSRRDIYAYLPLAHGDTGHTVYLAQEPS